METEAEEAKRARPRPSWSNDDTLTQPLLDARDDDDNDEIERCPEDKQNVFSAAFFGWLSPMLVKGSKKPLEYHDMPVTSKRNRSARTRMEFDAQWRKAEAKHGKKDLSLLRVLAKSHWPTLLIAYALKLVQIIVNFARPIILEELLAFLTTRQVPQWLVNLGIPPATLQHTYGYALAVLLALCAVGQSIFQQHFLYRSQQAALRVVNSLMSAIFAKSLKLNAKSRSQFEQGQIINLIGADTGRLYQFIGFSMDSFWSGKLSSLQVSPWIRSQNFCHHPNSLQLTQRLSHFFFHSFGHHSSRADCDRRVHAREASWGHPPPLRPQRSPRLPPTHLLQRHSHHEGPESKDEGKR